MGIGNSIPRAVGTDEDNRKMDNVGNAFKSRERRRLAGLGVRQQAAALQGALRAHCLPTILSYETVYETPRHMKDVRSIREFP